MTTVTFDTLKFVRKLEAAGVQAPQAEATAEALAEALSDEIVSRQYLDLRLAELQAALKHDILDSKADVLKWLVPLLIGQAALIATLVKLL